MTEVGIRELKQRTSDILRRVRLDKETILITYRGRVVARLTPVDSARSKVAEAQPVWAEIDDLAAEISTHWRPGLGAAEAVKEQRREL